MTRLIHLIPLLVAIGCAGTKPLQPGTSAIRTGVGTNGLAEFRSEMKQPENPAQSASQNFERTTEIELPLAAGTKVVDTFVSRDERGEPVTRERTIVLGESTVQKTRIAEKAGTVVGAAQKDVARELGAKLASMKGVVWVGVVLFVFGVASIAWPPLRAIIGSLTTSIAIIVGGLALIVLPTLVVGNEMLILGGVGLGVSAWFLAHRHGQLRGIVEANRNQASPAPPSTRA
jgi:hypothetical protein